MILSDVKLKKREPATLDVNILNWNKITQTWESHLSGQSSIEQKSEDVEELILMSFNIMKETIHLEERMGALIDIIQVHFPHFIAFQENNNQHYQIFLNSSFIREHYYLSDFTGQNCGFKCTLWSRIYPLQLTKLEAHNRPFLIGVYPVNRIGNICVSSVHLTSGNNASKRQQQIKYIYQELLSRSSHSFLMGDCNACQSEDDLSLQQQDFLDSWLSINNSNGSTRHTGNDIYLNNEIKTQHMKWIKGCRLDRIMIHSDRMVVTTIEKIGTENIFKNRDKMLYISDHCGLLARIKLV